MLDKDDDAATLSPTDSSTLQQELRNVEKEGGNIARLVTTLDRMPIARMQAVRLYLKEYRRCRSTTYEAQNSQQLDK